MNETIGVKGGKNDRRRSLKIEKQKKKKMVELAQDEQLRELERKVKRKQAFTLVKALPIAVVGGTIKTLYETGTGRKPIDKEEEYSKWRIKEYDADHTTKDRTEEVGKKSIVVVTSTGRKVVVHVDDNSKKASPISIIEDIIIHPTLKEETKQKSNSTITQKEEEIAEYTNQKDKQQPTIGLTQKNIQIPKAKSVGISEEGNYRDSAINVDALSQKSRQTLEKLKARKIIEEYERQLKDARFELRQLVSDYNMIADQANEIILSKEAQSILEKLSDIISRIEELKSKIRIDDLDKYDDNYIYVLVEGYLNEFKDKRLVAEIKDSPLYVLIAEKLDELEARKTDLSKKVEEKKDELEEKEVRFDELKEKFLSIDRINKQLIQFQDEQDRLLKEVKEKVRNAQTVQEKVQVEFEAMSIQSRRALRLLTLQMLLPGPRAAKSFAATSAAYLYFMRQILHPKTTTKKYRVITVTDYSKQIKGSIEALDDATSTLSKTSGQIDKILREIREDYKDYIGVIQECDEIISNLEKIKRDLREKEYEMEKTKEEQVRLLEKNNAKVKKRGTYQM